MFPLRFGRQAAASPLTVRRRFVPGHVDHRMRAVGVPLGLPRHLARRGGGERAEIIRRYFPVEHLERPRERTAQARILRLVAAVIARHAAHPRFARRYGTPDRTRCPGSVKRCAERPIAAGSPRVVTLLLKTASICVSRSALNLSGAAPGMSRPLTFQPVKPWRCSAGDIGRQLDVREIASVVAALHAFAFNQRHRYWPARRSPLADSARCSATARSSA